MQSGRDVRRWHALTVDGGMTPLVAIEGVRKKNHGQQLKIEYMVGGRSSTEGFERIQALVETRTRILGKTKLAPRRLTTTDVCLEVCPKLPQKQVDSADDVIHRTYHGKISYD